MGEKILPFFLPMYGCPHHCIFCDQQAISGEEALPKAEDIRAALRGLTSDGQGELAYYGGSFTCLPRSMQESYLALAQEGIKQGKISGIRISTRPDAVSKAECEWLRAQQVTTVELGIQSFDSQVLLASGRGYGQKEALAGCRQVKASGLRLGLQLMTGLPKDSPAKDRASMAMALGEKPSLLRIYPTLVLKGTPLAQAWEKGEYRAQTLAEAVAVCRDMLALALCQGVTVQRMGINPSPQVEEALLDGPYHPAFGGLVREALKYEQILWLLRDLPKADRGELHFPTRELPLVFGQKRRYALALGETWPNLVLVPEPEMEKGALLLRWAAGERKSREKEFLTQYRENRIKERESLA